MIRTGMAAGIALLAAAGVAAAQTAPGPLRWQAGQVFTYRVEQVVYTADTVPDGRAESKTKLNLLKRWQVVAVDAAGVATLQLSLGAVRYESTTPTGDVLLYDSANPDKCTPELRAQFGGYLGKALALLRVDGQGRVVEVKESKFGPASRFENELPFVGVLPAGDLKAGQEWQRDYKVSTATRPDKYDAGAEVRLQERRRRHGGDGRDHQPGQAAAAERTAGGALDRPAAGRGNHLRPQGRPDAAGVAQGGPGSQGPPGRREQLPPSGDVHGRISYRIAEGEVK